MTAPRLLIHESAPAETRAHALPPGSSLWLARDATATLLVVDAVEINRQVLKGMLKASPYRILEARHPSDAFAILERESIDLVIADMMMPEMAGPEFCRRLKGNRRTRLTPILILTSVQGVDNEVAGLESGADEFLLRPLQPAVVRTRIRAMLRNKRAIDRLEEAESILFALAQTVEQRDKETGNHCQRLATYSVAMGVALGLPEDDLLALHRGGYLHDIGKIAIPDSILFKKGSLSEEEWVVMRSHASKGEEICRPMKTLAPVLPIIRNHHERWDGSGYPDGMRGEDIPLLARILQLADIYDALTSPRSYKPAIAAGQALEILSLEAQRGWRDAELLSVFCELLKDPNLVIPASDWAENASAGLSELTSIEPMRTSLANLRRELTK
jgi:putative two-component system response regulator